MADKQTIADRYALAMRIHGHGYGLYHTASCRDIRPGVCGYVDSTGVWQHIVDLGDKKALEREGYKQIGHLVKGKSAEEVWEEMTSEGVSSKKVEANVGGDTGAVGARIHFSLDSSTKDGAVLLCNTSVFREGYRDEGILWKWGKVNAKSILKNRPDVKQYGFYVVKATWVTEDVWVNAWTDSQKDISIGFDVHAAGHGELAPKIQYKKGTSAGGWVHPVPKVEKSGKVEKRVIFFKGIGFKYRLAVAGISWVTVTPMRGDEMTEEEKEALVIADRADEGLEYIVEVEAVGKGEED